jgi:SAM-dependent methyltransferase
MLPIDKRFYTGKDWRPEPDLENKILEDLKTLPEDADMSIRIREKNSAGYLYRLSHVTGNPARFLSLDGSKNVLEIGGDCGTVTRELSLAAASVTSIVFSEKRAQISALRNRSRKNIRLIAGMPMEVLPNLEGTFDVITLFHVCEYAPQLVPGSEGGAGGGAAACGRLIAAAMRLLSPGGKIVIASPNRLGLKYFAGCRDASGGYFRALCGGKSDSAVRTFSRKEWESILRNEGLSDFTFYYPYPDEYLPLQIYSDSFLPKPGELCSNNQNFDSARILLFDETEVFDALIGEDLFPEFSNGFLITASCGIPSAVSAGEGGDRVLFEKFSNERSPRFSANTQILEKADGSRLVRKSGDSSAADDHIRSIFSNYEKLKSLYEGTALEPNRCRIGADGLYLEYESGTPYDVAVDEAFREGGRDEALKKIDRVMDLLFVPDRQIPFCVTEEFQAVFGKRIPDGTEKSLPVSDIDMILPNILEQDGGRWCLLDYEWTFPFPVPVSFLKWRILHYYLAGGGFRGVFSEEELFSRYGIRKEQKEIFGDMERHFQKYTTGDHVPLASMYGDMTPGNYSAEEMMRERMKKESGQSSQGKADEEILRAEIRRLSENYDQLLDLYEASQNQVAGLKKTGVYHGRRYRDK